MDVIRDAWSSFRLVISPQFKKAVIVLTGIILVLLALTYFQVLSVGSQVEENSKKLDTVLQVFTEKTKKYELNGEDVRAILEGLSIERQILRGIVKDLNQEHLNQQRLIHYLRVENDYAMRNISNLLSDILKSSGNKKAKTSKCHGPDDNDEHEEEEFSDYQKLDKRLSKIQEESNERFKEILQHLTVNQNASNSCKEESKDQQKEKEKVLKDECQPCKVNYFEFGAVIPTAIESLIGGSVFIVFEVLLIKNKDILALLIRGCGFVTLIIIAFLISHHHAPFILLLLVLFEGLLLMNAGFKVVGARSVQQLNVSSVPLQENRASTSSLKVFQMRNIHASSDQMIHGVASLKDCLFLLFKNYLSMYQVDPFTRLKHLSFPPLENGGDLALCSVNRCIYILEIHKAIWKLELSEWKTSNPGQELFMTQLLADVNCQTLSVTKEGNLLIVRDAPVSQLQLYSSNALLLSTITLPDFVIQPVHAVETNNGTFLVCFYGNQGADPGVCEVTANGRCLKAYKPQVRWQQLYHPSYIAYMPSGRSFIADEWNGRILLLDTELQFVQVVLSRGDDLFPGTPCRLIFSPESNQLLAIHGGKVCLNGGGTSLGIIDIA